MWSLATRSLNTYGPVPTGCVMTSGLFGATLTDAGEMIAELVWVSAAANGENWLFRKNCTCVSSTATTWSMPVFPPRTPGWLLNVVGLSSRSKLNLTAAALNGVPSENLTPERRVNVQLMPSDACCHVVAGSGWSLPVESMV